jgi:DNA-binding transcriptional LysR family regulator
MERLQRISEFWNWLPAFRAVAETGHLPTAAKLLGVGPSSLSRSISLLEKGIGTPLFDRVGRRIVLNRDGRRLLGAVRDSMRRVDDGYAELVAPRHLDPITVSTVGVLSYVVVPALREVQREHPGLVVRLRRVPPSRIAETLLRGQLDIAVIPDPPFDERLQFEKLGEATSGVYCGEGHPLWRSRAPSIERILDHPFAAPVPEEVGPRGDLWPPSIRRRTDIYISEVRIAIDLCAAGELLAVLPDFVAPSYPDPKALRRLPLDLFPTTTFYAVRRPSLASGDLTERVIETIRLRLRERLLPKRARRR